MAEIGNIDKTLHGVEYAYEQEGKFDTKYIANCVECGEKFGCDFYAPSNYTKDQLMDIGQELASGWGAQCINVKKMPSEQEEFNKKCAKFGRKPEDYRKKLKIQGSIYYLVGFKGTKTLIVEDANKNQYEVKYLK